MKIELHKTAFGFSQDCTLEVENKHDGVHITVLKADYPILINENVVCQLVNRHAGTYDAKCYTLKDCKNAANNGFLDAEIRMLKEQLERAEFAKKLAKRNKVFVFDKTTNIS